MDNPETLVIGGSMGATAVGAVAWFVKAMGARIVKQFDDGNAATAKALAEMSTRFETKFDSLSGEVNRNTAQTTGLAAKLGAMEQRIENLEERLEGQRDFYRNEHEKLRAQWSDFLVSNARAAK
jgi:hypothetical protein